jgi:hypothetical protein
MFYHKYLWTILNILYYSDVILKGYLDVISASTVVFTALIRITVSGMCTNN